MSTIPSPVEIDYRALYERERKQHDQTLLMFAAVVMVVREVTVTHGILMHAEQKVVHHDYDAGLGFHRFWVDDKSSPTIERIP